MTETERDVRDFVEEFDTPNTRRLLELAETGQISWMTAAGVAHRALAAGLASRFEGQLPGA